MASLIKIAHLETLINDNHLCTRDQVVDAARTAVEGRVKVKRQARLDDFANLSAGEPGIGESHGHVRTGRSLCKELIYQGRFNKKYVQIAR